MKRNAKLALICFSMCSLFAFTEAKAQVEEVAVQEVITDTFFVEDLLEGVEEVAVEEKKSSDFTDFYFTFATMDANSGIAEDLGFAMPDKGIGLAYRMELPIGLDHFTVGFNFGYTFGLRTYSENSLDMTKARTFTHSAYIDYNIGARMFFSKNHKNGMSIYAGFGYDYGELQLSKSIQGYAMVLDSKVIQHAFYVPVGVKFFFGNFSLMANYRYRAFDIDMTVESRNPLNTTSIKEGRTLNLFPLEIGIGFQF